jgi:hypothetical protein
MAPRTKTPRFESEAALCEAYVTAISTGHYKQGKGWTIYPETSGWDLLLVRGDGVQIGIEAKLALNPLVVSQALPGVSMRRLSWPRLSGRACTHPAIPEEWAGSVPTSASP